VRSTAALACFLGASLGAISPAAGQDKAELALKARAVFKSYCHRCHNGEGSEGGNFDVLKDKTLTSAAGDDKPVIVSGKPAESLLWERAGVKKSMPPKKETLRPTDADLAVVKQWIEAGAPPYPTEEKTRQFIPLKVALAAVRDHLRDAEKEDRPYLRYFTLTHLYNNPRVPDGDLAVYRAALSKALNSLSWKTRIVLPKAIDKQQTIFAVDIRDLDWDRDHVWKALSVAYPYGLTYEGSPSPDIQKLDDDIRLLAGCKIPIMRADWLASVATRPPLYYALLKIPADAGDLERRLKVDVAANFRRATLARAAFVKSGVSEQNRLIERHEADYGAYWKSYDFKKGSAKATLTQLPLGPQFDRHPYPDLAFKHDGGEIICNLPNGLQAYMLVNGKDGRIDEGPIEVVNDALKTSGTNVIVCGLSCMACHKHGTVPPPKDVIRDGSAVFGDARRLVQRLYPEDKRMAELLKEDEERFLRAAEKATGPFLRVGADKDKAIRDLPEPVSEVARLYGLQELDLGMAACELGVEKADELRGMITGNKRLRELGLAPLLKDGGVLKRADWERGANSLMQRVARELELGSPNREVE
jgi:serine/threonine-protein kinase